MTTLHAHVETVDVTICGIRQPVSRKWYNWVNHTAHHVSRRWRSRFDQSKWVYSDEYGTNGIDHDNDCKCHRCEAWRENDRLHAELDKETQRNDSNVFYWTTPNDANYRNHHARVYGIEFFAFPHQSMYARDDRYSASVADTFARGKDTPTGGYEVERGWTAQVFESLPSGHRVHVISEFFPQDKKDEAFRWAASQIIVHNHQFQETGGTNTAASSPTP